MEINWSEFKQLVDNRAISIQYISFNNNYYLKAIDGYFTVDCIIPSDRNLSSDTVDFEDNYLANGNSSPSSQVTTQFEKRDKTLKLFHGSAAVDGNGDATILAKVPGTPGSGDGRWISSGMSFFDVHTPGDKVLSVSFTDEDNILELGAGYEVGTYTDSEADAANRGWAIPPSGWVKAEAIGGYGFAPSGFYIKIVGKKAGANPSGNFYCNLEWGKTE